ncbi:MAG: FAD-dependent oxidoreductase [Anaerolineales bacterium]|nr:FAD-dependent oxidoreductase [Anaerolineales bacterium]
MTQKPKRGLSRRAFLQTASLVGTASLLPAISNPAKAAAIGPAVPRTQGDEIDVAIVGAGVSGVYSAWRLKQDDPSRNIVVFDAADYVGGRLLSLSPPDISNMVADLGGMRILPSVQTRIGKLLDTLNGQLAAEGQIETYDFPVDQPQNIAFLRDTHLRLEEFTSDPDKVPFNLTDLERGQTGGGIVVNAIEQIVPGITSLDLDFNQRQQMLQEAVFDGTPLYQQGFWNVLLRIMSDEAYKMAVDTIGYNIAVSNWNAADGILGFLADFGVSPVYKGFTKGFQQLPLVLADLFTAAGGEIRLNSPVAGFDEQDGVFNLQVGDQTVQAKSLILAMPRRALELIAPTSPLLQQFPDLIASVTPQPLFKIFTTYDNPWWLEAGYTPANGDYQPLESGRSVTDLPLQQTYYWAQGDGSPVTAGPAMLMSSYDDGSHVSFWDGLRPARGQAWREGLLVNTPADPFVSECDPAENRDWCAYQAPRKMVAEVSRQLAKMHDLSYTPEVKNATYRDWGDDPYGGALNFWNVGVKSGEVIEQIVQPVDGHELYICGEAYSNWQGWVEGALQTADLVLAKYGLEPL